MRPKGWGLVGIYCRLDPNSVSLVIRLQVLAFFRDSAGSQQSFKACFIKNGHA